MTEKIVLIGAGSANFGLEAVSDILLYETSTPNLDDVVRVLDDSHRLDGKILQEHY